MGMIQKFQKKHAPSRPGMNYWLQIAETAHWKSFPDVKITFNSADYVPPFVVFDVCGNNYRIVTPVDYKLGIVQVDEVMTHSEYKRWSDRR